MGQKGGGLRKKKNVKKLQRGGENLTCVTKASRDLRPETNRGGCEKEAAISKTHYCG